jgi:putative oxidoreductase
MQLENVIHRKLVRHSTDVLRVAVGAVFLGFGVLKFFPGVSPAESLVMATTDKLTLGLVPGHAALVVIATLECFIGVCMLVGRWMRLAIWLLALQFVGILSPLVLLPARLFGGPYHAPTLEGQYVLKDVILVAAGMVIAAATFRGGRLVREDSSPIPSGRARARRDRRVVSAAARRVEFDAELFESEPDSALDRSDRLVESQRDLGMGEAAEEGQVERALLRVREPG